MEWRVFKLQKPVRPELKSLADPYQKRLRMLVRIQDEVMRISENEAKASKQLERLLQPHDFLIGLDERGSQHSSKQLAKAIVDWSAQAGVARLNFVVGDAFSLGNSVRNRCNAFWSLSSATFPSEIAWLLVWEQLYRASTLIHGLPYHHD